MVTWNRILSAVFIILAVCQIGAAGKDPIGWSQSGSIPPTSILYTPYQIQYTFTNNGIPSGQLQVNYRTSSDEFSVSNGCAGTSLGKGASCVVTVSFTPKMLGRKTLTMSIGYGYNMVNLPGIETNTSASKDPISLQQTAQLPADTSVGSKYNITYTIANQLPYVMDTPLVVNHQASTPEMILTDTCTGQKLPAGGNCTIDLAYSPTTAGKQSLNLSVSYGSYVMQLPVLETKTSHNGTPKVSIKVTQALPTFARVAGVYDIVMQFSNSGTAPAEQLVFNKNYPKSFTENNNTCGSSIKVGDTCEVTGSFFSPNMGSATVGLTLDYYGGSVSASTSTKVIDPGLGRILTVINNCDQDVWFATRGGSADDICVDDTDCPVGSKCKAEDENGAGVCYWPNPIPQFPRGEFLLNARGGSNYFVAIDYDPEFDAIWGGEIAGRTNCVGNHCQTADCHSEGGAHECPIGVRFDKPATTAKFSLMRHSLDTYKIDATNGVNLPMSITPTNRSASTTNPYLCGSPGAIEPSHASLGACSWTFAPPANEFIRVQTTNAKTCTADVDCSEGEVCGLSYDTSQSPVFQKLCGKKVGYWTANAACALAKEAANPYFQCEKQLSSYTVASLLSCATPNSREPMLNSCYAFNSSSCCGCANWDELGITVPATNPCASSNPDWVTQVLPGVEWLKKACPTMAVYPYDDKSSSFSCETAGTADNQVDYTVTFCPK